MNSLGRVINIYYTDVENDFAEPYVIRGGNEHDEFYATSNKHIPSK